MRLALINLSRGVISGGYQKYLSAMVPLFRNSIDISDLKIFLPKGLNHSLGNLNIEYYQPGLHALIFFEIQRSLKLFSPDVIFVPSTRGFSFKNVPIVNMLQNMEPFQAPFGRNPSSECFKNVLRAFEAKSSVHSANRTIVISNHVKNLLFYRLRVPLEKVGLVYHGIEKYSYDSLDYKKPPILADTFPFLFTAGSIRPARGLEDAIRALPLLLSLGHQHKLVIAGRVDPGMKSYFNYLVALALKLKVSNQIVWIGQINSHQMAWCLDNCSCFVMTSHSEACPVTVLESLRHGSLIVSTTTPPMPEFYVDNCFYYNAHDYEGLAHSIHEAHSLPEAKILSMRLSSMSRAESFSWDIAFDKTMQQLKLAMTSSII